MWSALTLDPSFKIKQGYPNLKVLNSLIIGPRVLQIECETNLGNHGRGILLCGQIYLGPHLQGQMKIAKHTSAYNSLVIGSRGLQCETNL